MRKSILTMQVDIAHVADAAHKIITWAQGRSGHYVCVSNVHMCIETLDKPDFRDVVNHADLVVADGRPIYWAQKMLGAQDAQQVRGMDLTMAICKLAVEKKVSIGLYGASPDTLRQFESNLKAFFPSLHIVIAISPPFRPLTDDEKKRDVERIAASGAQLLLVGLGCPKQEMWMAEHKALLTCTMVGIGAVFDFVAGNKKHAPKWMQLIGLEWLFRLMAEPKRLWRRYVYTNPKFLWCFFMQCMGKHYDR